LNGIINPTENIISTTITIEKNPESIEDLSSIENIDTTTTIDHPSTLLISSTNISCSTGRHLVLTTSSLDENQKVIKKKIFFFDQFSFLVTISFICHSF
jgi:hypothetical protein